MHLPILARAAVFVATAHFGQTRKDIPPRPYVEHPLDVFARLLSAGVRDTTTLVAGLLHDTMEDGKVSFETLSREFGHDVASTVSSLSYDKRIPQSARKRREIEDAKHLTPSGRAVRIADKTSNLYDVVHREMPWPAERKRDYAEFCKAVVDGCRGLNQALEHEFDVVYEMARLAL